MKQRNTGWLSVGWAMLILMSLSLSACNSNDDSSNTNTVTTRTWLDVAYAATSTAQKLDIYLPATGNGPFPTVIWIHGGAFKFGDKANPQSLTALNNAGYAVASVNYRLSGEAQWPAQLEDLKSIVTYLRTNASQYALDSTKFAAWGASAGGHLASMTGIALASDANTRVQAVVNWFGPMDFYNMDADMIASGVTRCTGANGAADSPESALIGATVSENKAKADAASPLTYLAALPTSTTLPPFLIMHGLMDCNIAPKQSERLHTAIQAKFGATKSTLMKLTAGTHGGGEFKDAYVETSVIDFLNTYLK
ncbi:alpha/beta hydrolase [Thiolinea disciformis]|uniref:alpha/beta hydrolase n=1 Tax=Thiolinea disciformis TaxID=125614 RepID=UPI0003664276|nr:alpha/beta hydrolase [Thiolinea disciformis]